MERELVLVDKKDMIGVDYFESARRDEHFQCSLCRSFE